MPTETTRTTITEAERLQLIGLFALHAHQRQLLDRIEAAAIELAGEKSDAGTGAGDTLTGSHLWELDPPGPDGVDRLLKHLGITVTADA